MTRAGLFITTAFLLSALAFVSSRSPHPAAAPALAHLEPRVAPKGAAGPLDGLYFLGGGETLTLDHGRFVFVEHGRTPPRRVEGAAATSDTDLTFRTALLDASCSYAIKDGHLWLGVMRRFAERFVGAPCDARVLGSDDGLPAPPQVEWHEPSGRWWFHRPGVHRPDETTFVQAAQTDRQGTLLAPKFTPAQAHAMAHEDSNLHDFFIVTSPTTAVRVSSGGCGPPRRRVEHLTRE